MASTNQYDSAGRPQPANRAAASELPRFLREPLYWIMALLFAVSVAGFIYLYRQDIAAGSIEMELAKTALQVGVVAVVGTLLTILTKNVEAQRADRKFKEELLREIGSRVTASYSRTKRARRKVRALGLDSIFKPTQVSVKQYDKCMAEVNEAQLELETTIKDALTSARAIRSEPALYKQLRVMEKYLGEVNRDYEGVRPAAGSDEVIKLDGLPNFTDFVIKGGSRFRETYSKAHKEARGVINGDLLALTSAKELRKARAGIAKAAAAPPA
jgi:hypothetical protein